MGVEPVEGVVGAKGAICYCLDEFSKADDARSHLARLRDELSARGPAFSGLTDVFDRCLLSHVIRDATERARVVRHLERYWFDEASPDAYFPGVPVASIYGAGVLKALDLALAGRQVVPLNAWWLVGLPDVKLLSLADVDSAGVTIGGRVTLLILTPHPGKGGTPSRTPIMGETAQAFVTAYADGAVSTVDTRSL